MSIALVHAGSVSGLVNLVDVLKEEHAHSKEERKRQIDSRKELRIPLDDSTNWDFVEEQMKELEKHVKAKNSVLSSQVSRKLHEATFGNSLQELPEFVYPEILESIKLRFRIPSNNEARRLQSAVSEGWTRKRDAIIAGRSIDALDADEQIERGISNYVTAIIETIEGIEGVTNKEEFAASIEALDSEGILSHLYTACRFFMSLPRKKALLCGALPPST